MSSYDASVEYHLRPGILPTRKQFVIGVICDPSDHNVVGMMMVISGHEHNYATYCPHLQPELQSNKIFSPRHSQTMAAPLIILIPISRGNFRILIPATSSNYCRLYW